MTSLKDILIEKKFRFNKQFGQNFLTDTNLLGAIVTDAGINSGDTVLEIGTGAGALTRALSERAKKVITYEIDGNLKDVLKETLADCKNVELIFADVMKIGANEILNKFNPQDSVLNFKVVANIPYYITTPLIFKFLELRPESITLMVQKEVAGRLTAAPHTAEYGAVTLGVQIYADVKVTRTVSRRMFYPVPDVDSAVIRINYNQKVKDNEISKLRGLIKSAFVMRRKKLTNNLIAAGYKKESVEEALKAMDLPLSARGEELSLNQFIRLNNLIR